ncbi:MAG: hypothetical protein IIB15_02825 [Chloroflexi bacterium]|nr:hypothetical protein [Chloroflexota bacterium]
MISSPSFTEVPTFLPGQLPPDLDLPIPEGSEIVGSVVMTTEGGGTTQVLLDVPGEPEAAFSSLANALAEYGWQSRDEFPGTASGFVSNPFGQFIYALFCSETESGSLNVNAFPLGDGLTDIRFILINNVGQSHCDTEPEQPRRIDNARSESPIPTLTTPPGVKQFGNYRSSGTSSSGLLTFTTQTDLEGTLSAVQVEAHYQGQLTEAGWTLLDNNTAGPSAWSTWQFTDDDGETWGAMLLILKSPGVDDNLLAYLRASR